MRRSIDTAERRIGELEQLVSTLRHDINSALAPALLMADRLRADDSPRIRNAGEHVSRSVMRVIELLKATRGVVVPRRG